MTGFFSLLFFYLNQEKIPYIVLRNYDDLPEKPLEGSDVDLLVDKKYKEQYSLIVKKAVAETGSFILSKSDRPNCLSYFIYQKNPLFLAVWLDAFTEMSSKSFIWTENNFLFKTRVFNAEKNFFTLSNGTEAVTLFIKEIFSGLFIKERYRPIIQNFVSADRENFIQTAKPYFGEGAAGKMADICQRGEWEKAKQKRNIWFFQLILKNFLQNPLKQTMDLLKFIFGYLSWQLHKKGISVAIIGPDGVGKTTVCDNLANNLKNLFFKKIYQYHGHFGFFPEWGKVYGWLLRKENKGEKRKFSFSSFAKAREGKEEFPRKEKRINSPRAVLSILYYGLEHFLAWPWIIYLKIRSSVVIFDRYFYDFVTLNTRSKVSFGLFWIISKLIHRPDLVFVLQAEPETIFARKKELALEEIRRQSELFENKRMSSLASVIFVNGEMPLEQVSARIEKEIFKKLSEKVQ